MWLRDKPDFVDLNSNYFAILDAKAVEGSVLVCKIGDREMKGDEVTMVRDLARHSGTHLAGMEYFEWEEQSEGRHGADRYAEVDYGDEI